MLGKRVGGFLVYATALSTSSPREVSRKLDNTDLLLIHSDGVREHFELFEYPGLLKGNAPSVAERVVDTLGKSNDDASCLAVRFLR